MPGNNKIFLSCIFLFLFLPQIEGQQILVDVRDEPLNLVLVELRGEYLIQFSFDDRQLANYSVTVSESFSSVPGLLNGLLEGFPLHWELMEEVYVIYPIQTATADSKFIISGQVLEKESAEPLPYSHVQINNSQFVTDQKGTFSFVSKTDSLFSLSASHLGCFVVDTILVSANDHKIYLTPFSYDLSEVVVQDNILERSIQMGQAAGTINLNSYISQYLPGNGDNAVFNLLRLQPGILAAGEQPNDLIIWGSYEGTSRVKYDGFTIWGLRNFNDNISAVNPFMTRAVKVQKGGFDATHDDLVGGMVGITGKTGRMDRKGFHFFMNNETVNGMFETPISQNSSMVFAYRRNYYNLFEPEDINVSSEKLDFKVDVVPDYQFQDFNAKYSWQNEEGSFLNVSFLAADDDFAYSGKQERQQNIIYQETFEENHQLGGSFMFGRNLINGDRVQFLGAWSGLNSTYGVVRSIEDLRFNYQYGESDVKSQTDVGEGSFELNYDFQKFGNHFPKAGLEMIQNSLSFSSDSFGISKHDSYSSGWRITGFFQDRVILDENVEIQTGLRMNQFFYIPETFLDPRLEVKIHVGDFLKLNAAWGSYHQFLVKSSLYDETNNFRYTWSLADGKNIPVMNARHWVLGGTWAVNNLQMSVESYFKSVDGLTRYVQYQNGREKIFRGNGRSYGADLFLKKDFGGNTLWASYSFGRAEELFPYFPENDYRRALHDQRHELKIAGLAQLFNHFHLSATYVFGSGFPLYANYISQKYTEPNYNRMDMALVYRRRISGIHGEAGISLLNALDHYNVKYSSFEQIPLDHLNTAYIDAEAVTFTPLAFVKLTF